jgi:hypothetical protein
MQTRDDGTDGFCVKKCLKTLRDCSRVIEVREIICRGDPCTSGHLVPRDKLITRKILMRVRSLSSAFSITIGRHTVKLAILSPVRVE